MSEFSSLYRSILIIDDDVEDQEILIEAVQEVDAGVHCFTATSGDEVLHSLAAGVIRPAIIFVDLNMPKLNGKQVLARLKRIEPVSRIPVVMYSTSFAPRDVDEIKGLGASFYLVKPSRFDELCQSLKTIFSTQW